jgi:hypothetical protein
MGRQENEFEPVLDLVDAVFNSDTGHERVLLIYVSERDLASVVVAEAANRNTELRCDFLSVISVTNCLEDDLSGAYVMVRSKLCNGSPEARRDDAGFI